MKLFVDSGNLKDIETLCTLGIIDGVTTNPSLLAKEPGDYKENLKKICAIVQGPVSGEVISTEYDGMLREGHDIAALDPHMVVKLPLTRNGIRACAALATWAGFRRTSRWNALSCYSPVPRSNKPRLKNCLKTSRTPRRRNTTSGSPQMNSANASALHNQTSMP